MGGYVDAGRGAEKGDGCCVLVCFPRKKEKVVGLT